jgi:hypothetical protein
MRKKIYNYRLGMGVREGCQQLETNDFIAYKKTRDPIGNSAGMIRCHSWGLVSRNTKRKVGVWFLVTQNERALSACVIMVSVVYISGRKSFRTVNALTT